MLTQLLDVKFVMIAAGIAKDPSGYKTSEQQLAAADEALRFGFFKS